MSENTFSYSADNDKRFRDSLVAASRAVGDLTIPLRLISRDFYKSEMAIFKLQGPGQYPDFSEKPFFAYWEKGDLKRAYPGGYKEYKKAKFGFDYPLLKASGALMRSVTDPSADGAINEIVGKNTLIIGTSIKYGIYHQSDMPRKKIPQRKFLFIGPEAPRFATSEQVGRIERWLGILNSFVEQKTAMIGKPTGGR